MNPSKLPHLRAALCCWLATWSVSLAHPGHYHPPGEDDEFNALRADWIHLHGWVEPCLIAAAVASAIAFFMVRRTHLRVGAAVLCGGSLALLAAL